MVNNPTILNYFLDAGPVVKAVMGILLMASLTSWTLIFQKAIVIKRAKQAADEFSNAFWSGIDLRKLYQELTSKEEELSGMGSIFHAGFKEFMRLQKQGGISPATIMEGAQRAMRIARSREMDKLEQHLPFLATVGSTSPYIGLFGTVWGIMTSFQALTKVQQATIAMVAPGISEALIATAIGLFSAIPAVIAYNRFASSVERLLNHYDTFQDEFSSILHRQIHGSVVTHAAQITA